jgi:hypothetical protein
VIARFDSCEIGILKKIEQTFSSNHNAHIYNYRPYYFRKESYLFSQRTGAADASSKPADTLACVAINVVNASTAV